MAPNVALTGFINAKRQTDERLYFNMPPVGGGWDNVVDAVVLVLAERGPQCQTSKHTALEYTAIQFRKGSGQIVLSVPVGHTGNTNWPSQAPQCQYLLQDSVSGLHHTVYSESCFSCADTCECLLGLRGMQAVRQQFSVWNSFCHQLGLSSAGESLFCKTVKGKKTVYCVHFKESAELSCSEKQISMQTLKTCQAGFKVNILVQKISCLSQWNWPYLLCYWNRKSRCELCLHFPLT